MRISDWSSDVCSSDLSLENLAPRVPSFYFGSFGAARPQLYIRGIGTRSFDPGSESSVGVFVDDVYAGRASGRSEERRVGKGCVSTGRFRWVTFHLTKHE